MFEEQRDQLHRRLRDRWGDDPGWEFRPNKAYGWYLLYRRDSVPMGEVRELIEDTFGFADPCTFILGEVADRGPRASRCGEKT